MRDVERERWEGKKKRGCRVVALAADCLQEGSRVG